MQTDTRMERWCIYYPHLSATNPAQFHAFRTNSRQRATGRGSISQYPMPNSRQLGSRIISFIRSALAKENIPVPCGMRSLKGRDYVLNYTPRGVDPRSDALRPGKQWDRIYQRWTLSFGMVGKSIFYICNRGMEKIHLSPPPCYKWDLPSSALVRYLPKSNKHPKVGANHLKKKRWKNKPS